MMLFHNKPKPQPRVVLYSRQGCHLCNEAFAVLCGQGIEPQLVDIDADADLLARFGQCVPVVEIDGQIRFRGKVDPILLRRLLREKT